MRRTDRHGRLAHPDTDRRRRPSDGFRLRRAASFDRVVTDALAEVPPPITRVLEAVPVTVVDVPRRGDRVTIVEVEVLDGMVRRLTVYRRPAEHRASSRTDLTDLVRDAIEVEISDVLGIDPDSGS